MTDPITGLVGGLHRLVLEVEKSHKQRQGDQQDKDKDEDRLLEGQIRAREPDTVLASKLKNAIVYSPDESKIGDISDLLIKANGKIEGIVIRVDGGEKNVALKWERFKVTPEPDGDARVILAATKEELQDAPHFELKHNQETQQQG
jgi:hypothetical protein